MIRFDFASLTGCHVWGAMKLEYNYRIGPQGIEFSMVDGLDDEMEFDGTPEQRITVQRYIMQAWQDAINKSSKGPDEIRALLETSEGQVLLQTRAREYLADIMADFPPDLDRRKTSDRRDYSARPRDTSGERRYSNKHKNA
jgi:hypothetical protein